MANFSDLLSPKEIIETAIFFVDYNNEYYFFNWNPKPKFYAYDKLGQNNHDQQWLLMLAALKTMARVSKSYCIVPELAPITGKLHCHGWFRMDDKVKWHRSVYKYFATRGTCSFKRIKCPIESLTYYYKEIHHTKQILQNTFCIVTDFTLSECLSMCRLHMMEKYDLEEKIATRYTYALDEFFEDY
uniref:Uncharacterized protein n=1 Tax=uncultured prokaryote TaxID=198431 RepID=A0A0H5Q246_9ZZZZ|nr:hypothetical protein [uncultured prokaryote]